MNTASPLIGVLFMLSLSAFGTVEQRAIVQSSDQDVLYKAFTEPGAEYRGKPFWSWNGELEKDELLRQIHVFKEMGMGGFFMHSRVGLITEYLGEEWFELTNACADEGKRLGMEGWIYDEDRWPSGTAGGMVTENPDYRMRLLHLTPAAGKDFAWDDSVFAAFACDLDGVAFSNSVRLTPQTPEGAYPNKTVLVFKVVEMPKSTFYNGYTYADTMNRKATDEYIRLTHDKYATYCGDRLGDSIVGVFTDEPHRGPLMNTFSSGNDWAIPWTPLLPQEFKERFGYDLVDRLPQLFLQKDGRKIAQVKWHYVDLTQQLFLENWLRPIYDWCAANNMRLTGHTLQENSLASQTAMLGSMMRFYEYMHDPGIDVLTEGNRDYWVVKQLSSVTRQLGQQWLMSELYGVTGWQFNFQSHKNVGDYQALFGINLRCHHLSWYTMEGEAKRDYPASIFYQSAWYKDYHAVETYYARLGYLLHQGDPVCDVLVIHPVESLWCQIYPGWAQHIGARDEDIRKLERDFRNLFMWLAGSHIDFDYGDEEMIRRLYRIEKDTDGTPVLYIGQAPYRMVIVPPTVTLRASTINLLNAFSDAGGTVVFAGKPPEYMNALPSDAPRQLAQKTRRIPFEKEAIVAACRKTIRPVTRLLDTNANPISDLFCQMRVDDDHTYVVAMNMGLDKTYNNVTVRIPAEGTVTQWDCLTGQRYRISAEQKNGKLEFTTDFAPAQERVYVVYHNQAPDLPVKPRWVTASQNELTGPFDYTLSEDNICVLDLAEYRIEDGNWQPKTEVLKIDQAVRDRFKLQRRGGQMIQPWYRKKFMPGPVTKGTVTMRFAFSIDKMPEQPVTLGIERPEHFKIRLNDTAVASDSLPGWWVDNAIRQIPLPMATLQIGKNTLELKMAFDEDKNIEAVYLIGDFGVRVDGHQTTLIRLPEHLRVGCVTTQGLPFYSGAITYHVPLLTETNANEEVLVRLPSFEGATAKVSAAGSPETLIPWRPYEAKVTEMLNGTDALDITIVLTRRNTFGPLHLVPIRSPHYGPRHWITEGDRFSMDYQLYPAGLLESPIIEIVNARTH